MNKITQDTSEIDKILAEIPLFSSLTRSQLEDILSTTTTIRLSANDILFNQGDIADRFFLVNQGLIQLSRISEDGDEKVIDIVQSGHTFAEAVMFMEAQRYPVNAEAIQDSQLLAFNNDTFRNCLRNSVDTCFRLMADMSKRLHVQLNEIDNLSLHNATYRLVHFLLKSIPDNETEQTEVLLSYPKNVLASRLSIKPETFSRIMGRLKQKNIIEVQGNHIVLRNVNTLRQLLGV